MGGLTENAYDSVIGTELSFGNNESDLVRAIRESAQQSGSRAGDQIVTKNLNIQPTIRGAAWLAAAGGRAPGHRAAALADRGEVTMADLKLGKLPDRTPVKLAISITPDLKAALDDYAALYSQSYGREEPITELVPAMLAAFLESDRNFIRNRSVGK